MGNDTAQLLLKLCKLGNQMKTMATEIDNIFVALKNRDLPLTAETFTCKTISAEDYD